MENFRWLPTRLSSYLNRTNPVNVIVGKVSHGEFQTASKSEHFNFRMYGEKKVLEFRCGLIFAMRHLTCGNVYRVGSIPAPTETRRQPSEILHGLTLILLGAQSQRAGCGCPEYSPRDTLPTSTFYISARSKCPHRAVDR
jgi:hypothetical protein